MAALRVRARGFCLDPLSQDPAPDARRATLRGEAVDAVLNDLLYQVLKDFSTLIPRLMTKMPTIGRFSLIGGAGALAWLSHGFYAMKGLDEPLEVREVGEEGVASFKMFNAHQTPRRTLRHGTSFASP